MSQIKNTPTSARERILLCAHDLFYQEGIRATGIDKLIAHAGVTKTTFYRHFPSKHQLVICFLEYRHQRWMNWFRETLCQYGSDINALSPTLKDWFSHSEFRGCAFINSVGELAYELPEAAKISYDHKQEMTQAVSDLLRPSPSRTLDAKAISLAIDGAIIHAQLGYPTDQVLTSFERLLRSLAQDTTS